jgi:hypothetical protein
MKTRIEDERTFRTYEAPEIAVFAFLPEKGFADSDNPAPLPDPEWEW